MDQYHSDLAEMFERQQAFTAGYSPLYSRLFGVIASWLSAEEAEDDPLVIWLLKTARGRGTLDVTLLLAAGLHRDVLAGEDPVAELARYYPTAGGDLSPVAPGFERTLQETILARSESLAGFIRRANVQTNETGRGLCWLLPSILVGWPSVHLVDLGASAGLNLVADLRSFRLVDGEDEEVFIDIGHGMTVQSVTSCGNASGLFERLENRRLPVIESRTGCDAAPFKLVTKDDEIALKSFIWGDQPERMDRLCEGIDAYRQAQDSAAPVSVYRCDLPQDLSRFLESCLPAHPSIPVVIYNTYMTTYLADKGRSFVNEIGHWASQLKNPVLWLQWEPARDWRRPPVEGWIAWTADLWQEESYQRWRLGWVHPHGSDALFEGDWGLETGDWRLVSGGR
ncbi:MAG: DUF2332 family protein [Candidatus Promineifilaceae bacterium]